MFLPKGTMIKCTKEGLSSFTKGSYYSLICDGKIERSVTVKDNCNTKHILTEYFLKENFEIVGVQEIKEFKLTEEEVSRLSTILKNVKVLDLSFDFNDNVIDDLLNKFNI